MLTFLDIGLIAIALISGLLAMMRGFTREILSIASWAAAAGASVLAYSKFKDWAQAEIQPAYLANAVLIGGTFLGVLILVSFVTARLSDAILDSKIGAIDRSLGFVFGVGRGLIIVVIAYLFFTWLVPEGSQPVWVKTARSKNILTTTSELLLRQLPDDPEKLLERLKKKRDGGDGEAAPSEQDPATRPATPPAGQRSSLPTPTGSQSTTTPARTIEQLITGPQGQPRR